MPQRVTIGLGPMVPKDVAGAVNQMIGWLTTIRFDWQLLHPLKNLLRKIVFDDAPRP